MVLACVLSMSSKFSSTDCKRAQIVSGETLALIRLMRPRRNSLMRQGSRAVRAAQEHAERGQDWVVDLDITKFFDHVNWDIPMGKIAQVRSRTGTARTWVQRVGG